MPHPHEKEKLFIPRNKDRRVKLTNEQREEIRQNPEGLSNHALAAKYGVSRRLIQFIRYPERQRENLLQRQERGGSKSYYKREKHCEYMMDHRKYKKELYEKGELVEE